MSASPDNFIFTVKGIQAARIVLGDERGAKVQQCKTALDQFREAGPLKIGQHEDSAIALQAAGALQQGSKNHAGAAVDPDPTNIETLFQEGVQEGRWQAREGEAGPQEPVEPTEADDVALFESRIYNTSMVLMLFGDGNPLKAILMAKKLEESTGDPIFDAVADSMKLTFHVREDDDDEDA